jgi:hypothetical protein
VRPVIDGHDSAGGERELDLAIGFDKAGDAT